MAHIFADRVMEITSSTGTGVLTLGGAALGFGTFGSACSVGDTVNYYIESVDTMGRPTGDFEWGLGTYSATNQLTRTTVRGSSNGGAAVSFVTGSKLVGIAPVAPRSTATRTEWLTALYGVAATPVSFLPLGVLQRPYDMVGILNIGDIRTNPTSRPILVEVSFYSPTAAGLLVANVGDFVNTYRAGLASCAGNGATSSLTFVVPGGWQYAVGLDTGTLPTIAAWIETR